MVFLVSLSLAVVATWRLETARAGISITDTSAERTPLTRYAMPGADGPLIVIAHGFAGSRQMMQAYALTLARAGYVAYTFDFEGHGQHTVPMSGDVDEISGTTRLLVEQTVKVISSTTRREGWSGPVGLLGHSMATDILIRASMDEPRIGPLVLLSAFSQAVDETTPSDMLLISGQWEAGLRAFGERALQMVDPDATEGAIVESDGVRRGAIVAPAVEHVGILYSRAGQDAALAWFDQSFGRNSDQAAPVTGSWFMLLIAGLVALVYPLSRLLPKREIDLTPIPARTFWLAALPPAIVTPLAAVWVPLNLLPVLVADYLALHLLLFGLLQLAILRWAGMLFGGFSPLSTLALTLWGVLVFGGALHRYGANFWPTPDRLAIIAALSIGAILFMMSDARLSEGGKAPLLRRWGARLAFLLSLGVAVVLDPTDLFFLAMIAPVIVLFYVIFGLMGRWVAARGGVVSAGLGQGVILAWALGVSFPLFAIAGGGQ
ncbi:alpha/beta hydrolase [Thalassococcus sp. S3]|nr:alpha/beta hydrolase [Thalassococcus sp. S3]